MKFFEKENEAMGGGTYFSVISVCEAERRPLWGKGYLVLETNNSSTLCRLKRLAGHWCPHGGGMVVWMACFLVII